MIITVRFMVKNYGNFFRKTIFSIAYDYVKNDSLGHMTYKKLYNPIYARPVATKLNRIVAYDTESKIKNSYVLLIMWLGEAMPQKSIVFPLLWDLFPIAMTEWWLMKMCRQSQRVSWHNSHVTNENLPIFSSVRIKATKLNNVMGYSIRLPRT